MLPSCQMVKWILGLMLLNLLSGCRPGGTYYPASAPTSTPMPRNYPAAPPSIGIAGGQAKLMIFGGAGHRVYLGCLNCSEYAADSVRNTYGTHGSAYSAESIFNHFS